MLDLLEIEVVCGQIIHEEGALNLTIKQLKERLAKTLNIELHLLNSPEAEEIIDFALLSSSDSFKENIPIKKSRNPKSSKVCSTKNENKSPKKKSEKAVKSKKTTSPTEKSIDRLKSYILKCGVRKVWKKELDGLNGKQSIEKLGNILRDLGMEGRPTLDKCKAIRKRREYEEEIRELADNNVLSTRLRSQGSSTTVRRVSPIKSDNDESE